jgi:hypothetical protein
MVSKSAQPDPIEQLLSKISQEVKREEEQLLATFFQRAIARIIDTAIVFGTSFGLQEMAIYFINADNPYNVASNACFCFDDVGASLFTGTRKPWRHHWKAHHADQARGSIYKAGSIFQDVCSTLLDLSHICSACRHSCHSELLGVLCFRLPSNMARQTHQYDLCEILTVCLSAIH